MTVFGIFFSRKERLQVIPKGTIRCLHTKTKGFCSIIFLLTILFPKIHKSSVVEDPRLCNFLFDRETKIKLWEFQKAMEIFQLHFVSFSE